MLNYIMKYKHLCRKIKQLYKYLKNNNKITKTKFN